MNKDAASQSSVSFYLILFCRKNIPAAKKFITKRTRQRIDHVVEIVAAVYRMINTLEDIGAISRNTMYRIDCGDDCLAKDNCEVKLNDGTSLELTQAQWNQVIASGLKACGFQS